MNKLTDENYLQIQGWMRTVLDLKGNEILLFALIYGFSQDGESEFNGSRSYIAEWLGTSLPTVDKSLQGLIEKGYIIKRTETINSVTFNRYKVNLQVVKKLYRGSKEILQGGGKEILHNNNNINNNIYNKESKEKEIFDFWNTKNIIKHKEMTATYYKAIQKAIKEYGVDEVEKCIDRYNQVIKDTTYYFDTRWNLGEFLKQRNALPDFLEDGSKWINYKNRRKDGKVLHQQEYTQEDYDNIFANL